MFYVIEFEDLLNFFQLCCKYHFTLYYSCSNFQNVINIIKLILIYNNGVQPCAVNNLSFQQREVF